MVKLFQIYYEDSHLENIIPGYIPYKNVKTDIYLESSAAARCYTDQMQDDGWFGAFSWKVSKKFNSDLSYKNILKICESHEDYDIICPAPSSYNVNDKGSGVTAALRPPRVIQKDVWETIDMIMYKLGKFKKTEKVFLTRPGPMVYTNTYVMKTTKYRDFLNTYLRPAIALTLTDNEISHNINKKTNYPFRVPKNLQQSTGYTYWPQIPFVFERLINIYIYREKLKSAWVL